MSGTVVFEDAKLQAVELIAETVTLNNFSVSTATTFQQTTNASNVTTNTLRFTNPATAFVTTGNVEIGTANLFVDTTTGRVGIGTTSPDEKLHVHVNDTSHTQLTVRNDNEAHRTGIRIKNAAGQDFNIQHVGGASMGSNAAIIENYSATNGGIEFYNKGDGKYVFRTTDSNNLRFSILNNGNVGVGGITPSSKLHVDGDVRMKTLSTNAIGEITPVYVRGTGNNNSANRIVRIGDTTHVDGIGRGLTLTIINASTHAHVSSTNYDTYGSQTDSNNLATALEGMTDAQIGILTSHDAFEDNMTGNLVTACFKLGLTRLAGANDDNNRHPYCAIFYGPGSSGVPGNHAIEVMKSDQQSGAHATLSTFLVDDSFMGQTVTNALYSGTADNTTPAVFVNKDKHVGIGTVWPNSSSVFHVFRDASNYGESGDQDTHFQVNTAGEIKVQRMSGSTEKANIKSNMSSNAPALAYYSQPHGATWYVGLRAGTGSGSNSQDFKFQYSSTLKAFIDKDDGTVEINFTGQHRTFIKDVPFTRAPDLEGLIVSADQNKYIKMSGGIEAGPNAITTNESLPVVSISTKSKDKKCFGVISASEDPETRKDAFGSFVTVSQKELGDTRVYINSVGEGAMWVVNTAGPLESGDYITTSNVAGYGMKQDSEFLANYTVAKITMDCDFSPATQPVQIIKKELSNVNYWVETTYSNVALEEYSNLTEENRRTVTDNETVTYQKIERTESTIEHEGWTLDVRQELVNVLDEHGQLQWEDHPTETEKAYKIRYLTADGTQTDEANAVHIAAFVGCTYHCG